MQTAQRDASIQPAAVINSVSISHACPALPGSIVAAAAALACCELARTGGEAGVSSRQPVRAAQLAEADGRSLLPAGSADCSDVLPQQVRSMQELDELGHLLETPENRNKLVSNASGT